MRVRTLGVVLAALALSAVAVAADTPHVQQRIVPGQAIGKVALGMSFAQVKKALGAPEAVISRTPGPFGRSRVEYSWNFTTWRVTFDVVRGVSKAVFIRSSARRERTKEGIGYGTLASRVEQAYGIECKATVTAGFPRVCLLTGSGGRRTFFVINQLCGDVPSASRCASEDVRDAVTEVGILAPGQKQPFLWLDDFTPPGP